MDLQKSPCYVCTKRESGCHAACKEYAEWAKMKKEANETLKKKNAYFPNFPKPETWQVHHDRKLRSARHSSD